MIYYSCLSAKNAIRVKILVCRRRPCLNQHDQPVDVIMFQYDLLLQKSQFFAVKHVKEQKIGNRCRLPMQSIRHLIVCSPQLHVPQLIHLYKVMQASSILLMQIDHVASTVFSQMMMATLRWPSASINTHSSLFCLHCCQPRLRVILAMCATRPKRRSTNHGSLITPRRRHSQF